VDTDVQKIIANNWKVKGLPTLWFLEPSGKKISAVPGYVEKNRLLMILKYIHTQNYGKISFHEFVKTQ
jgi:thioredoxin-related protein